MGKLARRQYGVLRAFRKVLLAISQLAIIPSYLRVYLVSLAGVQMLDRSQVFIGEGVMFDNLYPGNITIGKQARITAGVKILTHYIDTKSPPFCFLNGRVAIGNNVFIGANSLIVKECVIGDNVVIAAGSVVTSDVPDNWIIGGVPAKKIGERAH